jgi:hypothetical protein
MEKTWKQSTLQGNYESGDALLNYVLSIRILRINPVGVNEKNDTESYCAEIYVTWKFKFRDEVGIIKSKPASEKGSVPIWCAAVYVLATGRGDYKTGFGLDDWIYCTQLVTTSNYNTIADLHTTYH